MLIFYFVKLIRYLDSRFIGGDNSLILIVVILKDQNKDTHDEIVVNIKPPAARVVLCHFAKYKRLIKTIHMHWNSLALLGCN